MKVLIQDRDAAAHPNLRTYAEQKLQKLTRHFDHVLEARLELRSDKKKSAEQMKVAELTVHMSGRTPIIRKAVQSAQDLREAIDLVIDKMDRQIREHKEKLKDHKHVRPDSEFAPSAPVAAAAPDGILEVKRYKLKPISQEQARAEMEALDHSFYLFLNEETQEVNLLYRREDGALGRLEADLS
jgi:putative sigma-54 modulation protein